MSQNSSYIIITEGCNVCNAEYVERLSDSIIVCNPNGETLILEDYNNNIPTPPQPNSIYEFVCNKVFGFNNPNNITYPTTLSVYNLFSSISGTTVMINLQNDIDYISGVTDTKLNIVDFNAYSGNTNINIINLQNDIDYISGVTDTKLNIVDLPISGTTNGLSILNKNVILGGALINNTSLTGNYTLNFCNGAKLNTTSGYQISGVTMFNSLNSLSGIAIGRRAGYNEISNNRLHIANNENESLIYGEFDNKKLKICGELLISTVNSGDTSNHVLTIDNTTNIIKKVPYISSVWGNIMGNLENQIDLQNALNTKSNTGHTHYQYLTGVTFNIITGDVSGNTTLQNALNLKVDNSVYNGDMVNVTTEINNLFSELTIHTGDTSIHYTMDVVNAAIDMATSGISWNSLQNKPLWLSGTTIEGFQTGHTHSYNDLTNKPTLFSGNYDDLINKPNLNNYQSVSGMSNYTLTGITTQLRQDFISHTGDTEIHFEMSEITGFTTTNNFNSYTGVTNNNINYISGNTLNNSFETVSKNLKSFPYTLNYDYTDSLTSIVYQATGGDITKTLNRTGELLTSIVLSGNTPNGILLTKTLVYTGEILTGVEYS